MKINATILPSGKKEKYNILLSSCYTGIININFNNRLKRWEKEIKYHLSKIKKNNPKTSYGYSYKYFKLAKELLPRKYVKYVFYKTKDTNIMNLIKKFNSNNKVKNTYKKYKNIQLIEDKTSIERGIYAEKKAYIQIKNLLKKNKEYKLLKGPNLFIKINENYHETDLVLLKNNNIKAIVEIKYDGNSIPKAMRQLDIRVPNNYSKKIEIKKNKKLIGKYFFDKDNEKWIVTHKPKHKILLEGSLWNKRSHYIVLNNDNINYKKSLKDYTINLSNSIDDYKFFWLT